MISKREQGELGRIVTVVLAAGLMGTFTADILKDYGLTNTQGIILSLIALLAAFYFNLPGKIGGWIGDLIG